MQNNQNKFLFNKAFLASGKDLKISDSIIVKHPKIEEIYELGNGIDCEDIYWGYINSMLCDPYSNMVFLDDIGIDYETQTPFDVFVLLWKYSSKMYLDNKQIYDKFSYNPINHIKESLSFFLGKHNFDIVFDETNDVHIIVDIDSINEGNNYDYIITSNIFDLIHEFLVLINEIDMSDKINPANIHVKKMLIEDKREEIKRHQKSTAKQEKIENIGTAINGICGGMGFIDYIRIKEYTIYQLLSTFKVGMKKINYSNLMYGIYSGNVDQSKINKKELTWIY